MPKFAGRIVKMTSQDYQNYVGKRLFEFQQEDIMSDLMLRSKEGDIIPVHKCVAAATSLLVVHAIKMNDTNGKAQILLEMENIDTDILQKTVEFMYLGQVDINDDQMEQLKDAATTLQMDNLCEACVTAEQKIKKKSILGQTTVQYIPAADGSGLNADDIILQAMQENDDQSAEQPVNPDSYLRGTGPRRITNVSGTGEETEEAAELHVDEEEDYEEEDFEDGGEDEGEDEGEDGLDRIELKQVKLEDMGHVSALSTDNLDKIEEQLLGKAETDMDIRDISLTGSKRHLICAFCSLRFLQQSHLLNHIHEKHPKEAAEGIDPETMVEETKSMTYSCSYCERTFNSRVRCRDHEMCHTGERRYKCTYCTKVFRLDTNRKRHERIHTNERPYACPFCPRRFNQKNALDDHIGVHTGRRRYQCMHCDRSFNVKSQFQIHTELHQGEDSPNLDENAMNKCRFCPRTFSNVSARYQHERAHNPHGTRMYSCTYCHYSTATRQMILQHERKHTGEKPFGCSMCEKRFTSKANMKVHEQGHLGGRFHCSFCSKHFTSKQALATHERVHTGEKPYSCRFCQQRFTQKHHVTQHERVHTGEKPYGCRFCTRHFSLKANRDVHERIHTGDDKPFLCQYCNRGFARKNKRADHELGCPERDTTVELNPAQLQSGSYMMQQLQNGGAYTDGQTDIVGRGNVITEQLPNPGGW